MVRARADQGSSSSRLPNSVLLRPTSSCICELSSGSTPLHALTRSSYSKRRIDFFVRLLITVLAVALLMAPVVVLFRAEESGGVKILIILLFTLFFSLALSIFTKAARQEVFAATAA